MHSQGQYFISYGCLLLCVRKGYTSDFVSNNATFIIGAFLFYDLEILQLHESHYLWGRKTNTQTRVESSAVIYVGFMCV